MGLAGAVVSLQERKLTHLEMFKNFKKFFNENLTQVFNNSYMYIIAKEFRKSSLTLI